MQACHNQSQLMRSNILYIIKDIFASKIFCGPPIKTIVTALTVAR
uniref:Uncharacterized protein n=1 Tax=Anguilla anguilla TaxID=7936 RepID=A0A0E9PIC3_ANGAN